MPRILATLTVVGALLFSAGSAWADFDDGVAAYARGDYATALKEFLPLAEQGDESAQYNLGVMYYNGEGVPMNNVEAVKWFRRAAKQGYVEAQYNLGEMYLEGWGVPQDHIEAVNWFRKGAEQNHPMSQLNVGVMYSFGFGVPSDQVRAYMWLLLAQTPGNREQLPDPRMTELPKHIYDSMSEILDSIRKQMTPAQIDEAQALADEWWEKHN